VISTATLEALVEDANWERTKDDARRMWITPVGLDDGGDHRRDNEGAQGAPIMLSANTFD
jgi:hypothetical protein